jgi:hypothetical protein
MAKPAPDPDEIGISLTNKDILEFLKGRPRGFPAITCQAGRNHMSNMVKRLETQFNFPLPN